MRIFCFPLQFFCPLYIYIYFFFFLVSLVRTSNTKLGFGHPCLVRGKAFSLSPLNIMPSENILLTVGTSPQTNRPEGVVLQKHKEKQDSEIRWGSGSLCHLQAKAQILILACLLLLTSTSLFVL